MKVKITIKGSEVSAEVYNARGKKCVVELNKLLELLQGHNQSTRHKEEFFEEELENILPSTATTANWRIS